MATLNSSDMAAGIVLSNGDLTASYASSNFKGVRSTTSKSWGLFYVEFTVDAGYNNEGPIVGISTQETTLTNYPGSTTTGWGYFFGMGVTTGTKRWGGQATNYGSGYGANGDIVGMAININTRKIWFAKNGSWLESGDPAADSSPAFSNLPSIPVFAHVDVRRSTCTVNFGASAFTYTPPSGFVSWDTDAGFPLAEVGYRRVTPRVNLHNRTWL